MIRIIGTSIFDCDTDFDMLYDQYQQKIHPYYASIREVIGSQEFLDGKVLESFVIPYDDKLALVLVE